MAATDIRQHIYLKNLWDTAYKGHVHTFDYTGEPEAEGRILRFRYALYNYRRRIRRKRLYPGGLAEEWARLQECRIVWLTPTILRLERIPKLYFGRKRGAQCLDTPIPFNCHKTIPDSYR